MRCALLLCFVFVGVFFASAQDPKRFARALRSEQAMDRWMKKELHRQRKGHLIPTPSGSYSSHAPTFDSLVAFVRRQPGVEDAAWDRCMNKLDIWPGHSTIGMRWPIEGRIIERCWTVQEGIPGTINLFGWHPRVRKSREHLKLKRAKDCPGFIEQQRKYCEERKR